MSYLDTGGPTNQNQSPDVWDCLCYINSNVKLVSDATFGKAYQYYTDDSAYNGWWDPGPMKGASELDMNHTQNLGKWDWYALAIKVPSTWNQPTWATMFEPNFPQLTSPPESVNVSPRASDGSYAWSYSTPHSSWWELFRFNGTSGSLVRQDRWLRPVEFGKWTEFVLGVKWATDDTGAYKVYMRVPADGEANFTLEDQQTNVNTYQSSYASQTTDIQMLYFGNEAGWPSPLPGNYVYFNGFRRYGDEASALAAFG
jgi:hypothetical protein